MMLKLVPYTEKRQLQAGPADTNKVQGGIKLGNSSWRDMTFLIDSGADVSVISTKNSVPDTKACETVTGIGGKQLVGQEEKFSIRFTCDQSKEYNARLQPTSINSGQEFVILGRDFLSQFDSTEFDWHNSKVRLCDTWLFYMGTKLRRDGMGHWEADFTRRKQQAMPAVGMSIWHLL